MPRWMKPLAGAFAALVLLYVLTRLPWGGRTAPRASAPEDPAKVRLDGPQSKVTLEKKGDAWRLTDPLDWPADEEAVRELVEGLKSLSPESEVTRRTESYPQYDLGEGKGVRVESWAAGGKDPFEVMLGKNAGFTDRAYIRLGKDPAVYLASGLRRDAADKPLSRWRDRQVLDRADLSRVKVTRGKAVFVLEKGAAAWTLDGKPGDEGKVQAFLSALRTLSADDFVDPPAAGDLKKFGLDAPSAFFEVSFSSGAPVSFSFGKGDPRPLREEGVASLYLIPSYRLTELDKTPKDLQPPSPK